MRWRRPVQIGLMALACALPTATPFAEYGDVVINKRSDKEGVRPVIFPHWFHRIRFRCKVCHSELGFKMRAGANDVLMSDIIDDLALVGYGLALIIGMALCVVWKVMLLPVALWRWARR